MTVSLAPQQAILPTEIPELEPLEKIFQQALGYHQSGLIEIAESLYRTILEVQPQHPDANHNLGVLAVQVKQAGAALPYLVAALQAQPDQQQYWLSYIDALIQADETETAKQALELGRQHGLKGADMEALAAQLDGRAQTAQLIETTSQSAPSQSNTEPVRKAIQPGKPAFQSTLHSGGRKTPAARKVQALMKLYSKGRLTEVEVLARSLTLRYPKDGFGWKVLGVVLQQQGRFGEALVPTQKGAELLPGDAEALSNQGILLKKQGRFAEAEASYRQALTIRPNCAESHSMLGIILQEQGRFSEAESSLNRALEIQPDSIAARFDLGIALHELGRFSEAEACFRRTLEINPHFVKAHGSLANVLKDLGRPTEAEASYRRLLEFEPDDAKTHCNLGYILTGMGRLPEAEASLRQALQLQPDFTIAFNNLLFFLSHSERLNAGALFAEHCRFGAQYETPLQPLWPKHSNLPEPDRCLQIGFVSGDLRSHAVASFLEPVLMHLAVHSSLSLHAYSNYKSDDVSQRLRNYVDHWHTVLGLSDAALAEKIRADGIDVLIDLSGHTAHNRLLTFARKPAPVQASWIGYPGTTGLKSMDYYLTDQFLLPPGQFEQQFTEKLVFLPAVAPFLPIADAPPVNVLPALKNGYVTFGSFNRPIKINRTVIRLWSQLLRALPDSRMMLGAMPTEDIYDTFIDWFADEGIDRDRLDFRRQSNTQDYLALHHQVDVCLDTFPYNGGTTTLHAVWMGVPTLTLAGSTAAGRAGVAILEHVGLGTLIAHDSVEFVQQGMSLVADLQTLADIRNTLRDRFTQSALSKPELVAAGLECALRIMWQRWCAGLSAKSFQVDSVEIALIGQDIKA